MSLHNAAKKQAGDKEKRQRFIISLIDLTSLNDDDSEARIAALCAKAQTPYGLPAALCVYKQFLSPAGKILAEKGIRGRLRLAAVANFPAGGTECAKAAEEVREALALGADEVDIVFPYQALMRGDAQAGRDLLRAARAACGGKVLKVILESGILQQPHWIKQAAEIAIGEGADFIKTSTGKAAVNATLPAARIMLEVIAERNKACGFKAAGGVRFPEQAEAYLALAAEILGNAWIKPAHFRFGASALLDNLLPPEAAGAGINSVKQAGPPVNY